jgi:WD40 repeat protein/DNA-binding CsgD family transcriptional regulator
MGAVSNFPDDFLATIVAEQGVTNPELEALKLALPGQTAEVIANTLGLSAPAVRKRLGSIYEKFGIDGKTPGKLEALKAILQNRYLNSQHLVPISDEDWGDAPDVSVFYGRNTERQTLKQWIVKDHCRLVALLGMGGIGKTALSLKVADDVKAKFEQVIWRSLVNAPTLQELLTDVLKFLGYDAEKMDSKAKKEERLKIIQRNIKTLIDHFKTHRVLLMLDNVESILQGGQLGSYRKTQDSNDQDYEHYGYLFQRIGEIPHKSCLILTSREIPRDIIRLHGSALPVRSHELVGLGKDAKTILETRGLTGSKEEFRQLIDFYQGNPLALQIVPETIQKVFDGKIAEFLETGTATFGDIRDLLEEQFDRLSLLEQDLVFWLAISREAIGLSILENDILPNVSHRELLEALHALSQRLFIQKGEKGFSLQNVVQEYATERFVDQIAQALMTEASISAKRIYEANSDARVIESGSTAGEAITRSCQLLNSHPFIKATAKDYIREAQTRRILKPVIDKLLIEAKGKSNLEERLKRMLERLQSDAPKEPGYAAGNILNLLNQLNVNLTGYDFSNLVIWQADLRDVNLHHVNFKNTEFLNCAFTEDFGSVLCVAFRPDGLEFYTGHTDGKIRRWDAIDGKLLATLQGHTNWIRALVFSPDGKRLISAGDDTYIRLWHVSSGNCLQMWHGDSLRVRALAMSPDGAFLASGGDDGSIRIWSLTDDSCSLITTLTEHSNWVVSLSFSVDGQWLASGGYDGICNIWDTKTWKVYRHWIAVKGWVWSVAFSPDSKTLAIGGSDRVVQLWDIITEKRVRNFKKHVKWVLSLAFSPDGQTLISGSEDHSIRVWQVRTGEYRELKAYQGHTNRVWGVAISPDGKTVVSVSDDQTIKVWEIESGKCFKTLKGYMNSVFAIAFSPTSATPLLASGYQDEIVRLWDMLPSTATQCNQSTYKSLIGHTDLISCLAFSPDGGTLASSGFDGRVKLWNVGSGQCLNTLDAHHNWVRAIAFNADGKILATASDDNCIKLWNPNTGELRGQLKGHEKWVFALSCSPTDPHLMASGSEDATLRLWNLTTRKLEKQLTGHEKGIHSIAFSADGKQLASAGDDAVIRLWTLEDGECRELSDRGDHVGVPVSDEHTNRVCAIAFSPCGSWLVSGGEDAIVRLWNLENQTCQYFKGHSGRVCSLAFSPDGQFLATGSADETIRIWNVVSRECQEILKPDRPYEGMKITGIVGLTEAEKSSLKALGAIEELEVQIN